MYESALDIFSGKAHKAPPLDVKRTMLLNIVSRPWEKYFPRGSSQTDDFMALKMPSSVISMGSLATRSRSRSCTARPWPRGPGDGLRAEILRLARTNEESARMPNQHLRSPGEAVPLRLQVRHLKQRRRSGGGGRGWAMRRWSGGGGGG